MQLLALPSALCTASRAVPKSKMATAAPVRKSAVGKAKAATGTGRGSAGKAKGKSSGKPTATAAKCTPATRGAPKKPLCKPAAPGKLAPKAKPSAGSKVAKGGKGPGAQNAGPSNKAKAVPNPLGKSVAGKCGKGKRR
ncbi:hypothetical protein DFJ73DRAFT_784348 [Zopfochytrium polystomum]|nr:hypothetical protein DFJ73DRAFT_784348 [Zopfochytrium polystomum]